MFFELRDSPVDRGRKLNIHKTFRRSPGRLSYVYIYVYLYNIYEKKTRSKINSKIESNIFQNTVLYIFMKYDKSYIYYINLI